MSGEPDFDDLDPEQANELLNSYRLLGDCFETETDEDMMGRGWLIESWGKLLRGHQEKAQQAKRELAAAVRLARNEGGTWIEIGQARGMDYQQVREHFPDS